MDNTILSGVISASIGLLGLTIGYLYREFQNRVKNFIHIYNIESDMRNYQDLVDVNKELIELCSKSELLDDLKKSEKYRTVYNNWDIADDFKRYWIATKADIATLSDSKEDEAFLVCLQKLFGKSFFLNYLKRFYLKNKAGNIKTKLLDKKITVSEVDNEGDVYIGFPDINSPFNVTKHPAAKAVFTPLLDNIATFDKDNIVKVFNRFVKFMDKEYEIAISTLNSLKDISNHQSRWAFYVQIANISSIPFLVELEPKLKIKYKKNEYIIDLYTTINKVDSHTGKEYIADITKPILIKNTQADELIVITKDREKDIEFGKTIREIFESKKGSYRIEWNVIKPGLFKTQKLKTSYKSFSN